MSPAERAKACKAFRWLPGMLSGIDDRVVEVSPEGWPRFAGDEDYTEPHKARPPDLTDPATLGCLLALVRQIRGLPFAFVSMVRPDLWVVWRDASHDAQAGYGPTEAGALVAALEAAP